jgi:hypothetical protein
MPSLRVVHELLQLQIGEDFAALATFMKQKIGNGPRRCKISHDLVLPVESTLRTLRTITATNSLSALG